MEDAPDDIRRHAQSLRDAAAALEEASLWADGDADAATGWVRRAAAAAWWRAARDGIPPAPAAALRELAERCRKPNPTSLMSGLFRSRSGLTLDEIADKLDDLTREPQHPLSAVRVRLEARFDPLAEGAAKRLLELGTPDRLLALARDAELRTRLHDETPPCWPARPAAAVAVARLLLKERAAGLDEWLPRWCNDFRLGFGRAAKPPAGAATDPSGWWFAPPPAAAAPPTDGEWASLPPPPSSSKHECPLFHEARRVASTAERAKPKAEFASWIRTDPGAEYLDWFLRLASSERQFSDAARRWWRAIRNGQWATVSPDYDPDTGETHWPAGVPMPREAVETVPSAEPPGAILAVKAFATDPTKARVTVSDGPTPLPPRLVRFYAAVAAADAAGWSGAWADGRWAHGRALALGHPGDAEALATEVLTVVADNPPNAERTAAVADAALAAIRAWAAGHELTVAPERWTFAAGCARAALPDSAAVAFRFSKSDPDLVYKVRRFGLTGAGGERWAAEVLVSAGQPPAGFQELKGFVHSEPARPLAELLARWPAARAGGYLPAAAIELFEAFWGLPGAALRAADPPAADGFAAQLAAVLVGFRLTVFHPQSLFDFADGWVQPVGDSPPKTGRVRTVHRPGVRDDANNLRLPALVEAD